MADDTVLATDGESAPRLTSELISTAVGELESRNMALERELETARGSAAEREEQITSLSVTYAKQLTPLTSFNTSLTFSETDPTAAGSNSSSVGTLGVGLERTLAQGLQLNLGFQHRVTENVAGTRARDNRLSVSLRRDLSARR